MEGPCPRGLSSCQIECTIPAHSILETTFKHGDLAKLRQQVFNIIQADLGVDRLHPLDGAAHGIAGADASLADRFGGVTGAQAPDLVAHSNSPL